MKNVAYVIEVGDRFFYGFGKGGRVLTAWSLPAAKLYSFDAHKDDYQKLLQKGKSVKLCKLLVDVV